MAVIKHLWFFLAFIPLANADDLCGNRGCTIQELNAELAKRNDENLYQVLSWDVKVISASDICDLIEQFDDLMVINLQHVSRDKYTILASNCLALFNSTGTINDGSETFNPIFYPDDNTKLKEIKTGRTSSKDRKCKSLSWVQLSLHVSKPSQSRRPRLSKRSLAANLFALLTGKKTYRKVRNRVARKYYLKKIFFANSDIAQSSAMESNTYYCMRYIYYQVMERRRSRAILSGNIGSMETVLNYPRRRSLFKHCEPGSSSQNQICISNRGSRDTFQYRLSTKIQSELKTNPFFVAFTI